MLSTYYYVITTLILFCYATDLYFQTYDCNLSWRSKPNNTKYLMQDQQIMNTKNVLRKLKVVQNNIFII